MGRLVLLAVAVLFALALAEDPPAPTAAPQQEEVVMALVVGPGKTECLFQTMTNPKYMTLEIAYQVTEGGSHDINFHCKSPKGVQILADYKQSYGNHKIDILAEQNGYGDYALCFDNSFSVQSKKHVFFELFLLDKDGNYLNNYDVFASTQNRQQELDTQVDSFERITTKVKNNMNEVERLQSQLRAVESRDRSIMESNFERVNFWSVVHFFTMVGVFAIQVYTLRSLFIEDSKVGRFIRKGRFND
jgi:protein ERP2